MNKTVFLIAAILGVGAASTFFILKPNPKKQMENALHYLKQQNIQAAENALHSIAQAAQLPFPDSYYMGCLEQLRGSFFQADRLLQLAYQESTKGNKQDLMADILFARAINSYCEERDYEFNTLVEKAYHLKPQHPASNLFLGLENYLSQNYAEALQLWSSHTAQPLNDWAALTIDRAFPEVWKKLHIAHCCLEEGNILPGREILEKVSHKLENDPHFLQLAALFLGLSYVKEAQSYPIDQRASFYKLARFYFERAKYGGARNDPFFREKKQVAAHVEQEARSLLFSDIEGEVQTWAFAFIQTLQEWRAAETLEKISAELAKKVLQHRGKESIALLEGIRTHFLGTPFHTQLTEMILFELSRALKAGEVDNLVELWNLVAATAQNPKMAAKEIATLTSDEILETIKRDDITLSRTRRFIAFWEKLGRSDPEREMLARHLLMHAKLFWHNEKQEKKGQRLMEIALKLSKNSSFIEKEISTFLMQLYAQAESSNLIRRLSLIYDAMECFELNRQEMVSKSMIANYLADAEYLFETRNYSAAKTHASWVLKLQPQNQNARRLVGLCLFNLGEYTEALCLLQDLPNLDEDGKKALMLSQVFASQEQERHLCQIDASGSFCENE